MGVLLEEMRTEWNRTLGEAIVRRDSTTRGNGASLDEPRLD
jgi:hypothetical protein